MNNRNAIELTWLLQFKTNSITGLDWDGQPTSYRSPLYALPFGGTEEVPVIRCTRFTSAIGLKTLKVTCADVTFLSPVFFFFGSSFLFWYCHRLLYLHVSIPRRSTVFCRKHFATSFPSRFSKMSKRGASLSDFFIPAHLFFCVTFFSFGALLGTS